MTEIEKYAGRLREAVGNDGANCGDAREPRGTRHAENDPQAGLSATDGAQDTREELEADVWKNVAYGTSTLAFPASANKVTAVLSPLPVDTVLGWLDRQAEITGREWERACDAVKAERDALASERDYCRRRYRERVDRGRREGEELRGRLRAAGRERRLPEGVEWPRFEDGALVEFGKCRTATIEGIEFTPDSVIVRTNRETRKLGYGARVQRPPLLASDGEPIEVGQVLYGGDGRAWEVERIDHGEPHPVIGVSRDEEAPEVLTRALKPEQLTHEPPDSFGLLVNTLRSIGEGCVLQKSDCAALADRIEKLARP